MEFLIFAVLISISAFFAGSETAIFSISKLKLHQLVREERKGVHSLTKLKSNPNKLLATILIGNNIVNIISASYATYLATSTLGSLGVGLVVGGLTLLILLFGETLPKSLAAHQPVEIALAIAKPMEIISLILYPIVVVLEKISSFFTNLVGAGNAPLVTEEELKSVIAVSEELGVLKSNAAEMIRNVIEFEDVKVGEVMTPEAEVIYLDGNKSIREVMAQVTQADYSRFPVYENKEENIIGVFDVDDVLKELQKSSWDRKIKELVQKPFVVPENKKVAHLLNEFAREKRKFSLVVDERGSYIGVVSLDDVLEEIVGDIFDKSLKTEKSITEKDGSWQVEGSAKVADLEKILHVSLKGDGFTTLAGLIETQLGRIPKKGEKVRLKKFEVEIEEADSTSIHRVRFYRLPNF